LYPLLGRKPTGLPWEPVALIEDLPVEEPARKKYLVLRELKSRDETCGTLVFYA